MRSSVALAILATLSTPASSFAFDFGAQRTPLVYADRTMTLPKGQFRVDAGPPDFALLDSGFLNNSRGTMAIAHRDFGRTDETFIGMGLGFAYGVLDDVELGTLFLPILFSPDFEFGDMEFYGRFRFLRGGVELGVQAGFSLPTNTRNVQTNVGLGFGIPAVFHLGDLGRIDTGAEVEVVVGDADGIVNLDIPLAFQFQATEAVFVGPKVSIFLPEFKEIDLGAGAVLGISVRNSAGRPIVDLLGEFYWPFFLASGRADTVNADEFNLIFGARFFFSTLDAPQARPPSDPF